jgi:HSP20 family protein
MALLQFKPLHEWEELERLSRDLAVDVYENKENVIVKMHVPGIDPDKIDITVENEHLYVRGSREEEEETEDQHYYHREIRHGSFERVIPLPAAVDIKKTTADCKDGVLTVILPKQQKSESSKIKISKKK